ncbi:MAG: hypothetical protein QXP42_02120 [Candidatus Micrarchaeia archaeon]
MEKTHEKHVDKALVKELERDVTDVERGVRSIGRTCAGIKEQNILTISLLGVVISMLSLGVEAVSQKSSFMLFGGMVSLAVLFITLLYLRRIENVSLEVVLMLALQLLIALYCVASNFV